MRHVRGGGLIALALALAAGGCKTESNCGDGDGADGSCEQGNGPTGTKPTSFESDLTNDTGNGGAKGGDASAESGGNNRATAPTAGQAPADRDDSASSDGDAQRAIAEADIIQTQGDRLYALSRIAGLAVIDVKDPGALKLLGRFRELPAQPFEMYLRDGVALVMFSGWGQYTEDEDGNVSWVSTSKLLALDVDDPAKITQLGSFDVPGTISDSRVVGDILYVVGYEDGYCWRCEQDKPRTSIVSLNVANPRDVKQVDQLFYANSNPSWGQRSVTVTTDRMYVAGPEYGQDRPTGSTIQVVDISDAAGDLVEGTSVKVEGAVNSRWQMDEYQGVLRVVSQPQQWWTENGVQVAKPAIETFKIESSKKLSELGRTDITIPSRDTLRSVRFDGERGYAITAEQKDPLYTLDLSDPAHPRTVGELKIPGFVYHMEPRGNRVLGLGFDNGNPAGGITVSLFDVSDMASPTELSRVSFGGNWGYLPEDQNRIHKVFRVLDDVGTILVPFSGWGETNKVQDDCYVSQYVGGVEIIDFKDDTLKGRGATPSQGETRRALLIQDKLVAVGDERVQSFDISDRDKPELVSQVVLSRNVARAVQLENGVVARISADYNKGAQWELDLVGSDDVADPNTSLSHLDLTQLATQAQTKCEGGFQMEDTFVRGTTIEVLYTSYSYSRSTGTDQNKRGLLVIDASDSAKPKLVSNVQWDNDNWQQYYGFYSYGYYGNTTAVVRTDSALALMESTWVNTNVSSTQKVRLRVLDLRDLENVKTTLFPFEAISSFSGLHADGDTVLTSHLEAASQDGRRGRFFIDRFDLSNPAAPKQLGKINVPGALMAFDKDSRRALTSEQVRVIVGGKISAEDCYKRFANADWTTDQNQTGGTVTIGVARSAAAPSPTDKPAPVLGECTGYKQRINLVHVLDDVAELDDRIELADDKQVFSFSQGDGVVFASVGRGGYYYPRLVDADIACYGGCGGSLQPTELLVLGGFDKGELIESHLTVEDKDNNQWYGFWGQPPVYAYGKRALLDGQSDLVVIDASDPAEPKIVKRVPRIGYLSYVEVHEDNALLTLGQQGVQWLDLSE